MFITSYRLYIIIESISLVIIIRVFIMIYNLYLFATHQKKKRNQKKSANWQKKKAGLIIYYTYFYTSVASAVWC